MRANESSGLPDETDHRDRIADLTGLANAPGERPIRTPKVAEQVAHRLASAILSGNLPVGSRLPPEKEMLGQFAVSRGTLREALRLLEAQGLIAIKTGPSGGPVVVRVTPRDFARVASLHFKAASVTVHELWTARLILEPVLVRMAAERRDPTVVEGIERLLSTARDLDPATDVEYHQISSEFHSFLGAASGNRALDLVCLALKEAVLVATPGGVFPPEKRLEIHSQHVDIAKQVIKGNGEAAAALMRAHMEEMLAVAAERFPDTLEREVDIAI